jgi:anti-sigma factor RsiW
MSDEPLLTGDTLLLHAALDGELDVAAMIAFEQRLAQEPALAAEYNRLKALRQAIHKLPKPRASDDFRSRIAAIATATEKPAQPDRGRGWSNEWQPAAIAASLALFLGSGLTFLAVPKQGSDITQDLIAGHVRGMISGQTTDVVTSDKHTVKPWFATRVVQAPEVFDLSAAGFTLDGGRIDVIGNEPVATLVFHHLKHIISVTELPGASARFGLTDTHRTVNGYSVLTWTMGDTPDNKTTYVAISDIAAGELDDLAAAFRKAVAADK